MFHFCIGTSVWLHVSQHVHTGYCGCYFCFVLSHICVCVCVCVCVCIRPGEVDDVLDSICVVHDSRDGDRPAAVLVSQELLEIMTLLSLLVINELLI